jgi:membrane protein
MLVAIVLLVCGPQLGEWIAIQIGLGALFQGLTTLRTSLGFSYYITNFAAYDATYGSIGAVIVLLTWMDLTGFFILVGGEINAELAHASAAGKPRQRKPPEKNRSARHTDVSL